MSAVGLDVGTTSTKGVAIDGRGEVLAVAESSYGLEMPRPGWAEQDPEALHALREPRPRLRDDREVLLVGLRGRQNLVPGGEDALL